MDFVSGFVSYFVVMMLFIKASNRYPSDTFYSYSQSYISQIRCQAHLVYYLYYFHAPSLYLNYGEPTV